MQITQSFAYQLMCRLDRMWENPNSRPPMRLVHLMRDAPDNTLPARRNSRVSRAHRLEAAAAEQQQFVQRVRERFDMGTLVLSQLAYCSDEELMRVYNTVESVCQRRGLIG